MVIFKAGWEFIQDKMLGMQWFDRLIGNLLNTVGAKCCRPYRRQRSIFHLRYNQNYGFTWCSYFDYIVYTRLFPVGANKKLGRFRGIGGKLYCRIAWNRNAVLFLFLYSVIYRINKLRFAAWSYLLVLAFLSYCRPGISCSANEYIRLEVFCYLCCSRLSYCRSRRCFNFEEKYSSIL